MSIKQINIKQIIPHIKKPWVPVVLGKVEDYEVRLVMFKGEYFWHKHEQHDEFILIYKGSIAIELKGGKEIKLSAGEGALIEKGTLHRSKAAKKALAVVFERETITGDFVKAENPN